MLCPLPRPTLVLALPALSLLTATPCAQEQADLAPRLERLVERLEEERVAQHIPGMALAVVHGDEIVLAHGFGLANLQTQRAVTPETLFAVGSTTKAFTTTAIGMLVDEGALDWDDPLEQWLPYFTPELDSEDENAVLSLRDSLCHRSGFTRQGILWASGLASSELVLRTAAKAAPWDGFRENFHYNNVMYLAGGMTAGVAAEQSWDELIAARLFAPLGMSSSSTSIVGLEEDERLALGYEWDEDLEDWQHKPMRNLDKVAPAGAINSNVLDMAQWVRLQLGDGVYEGERLISAESLAETREAQIEIGAGASYGLGWFLREFEGEPLIEHGGNIDGFAAQVSFWPESDLGYVLLANVSWSPLQQGSLGIVHEILLGEDEESASSSAEELGLEAYEGEYVADFGGFEDARFTVQQRDGKLAVDVPGQMLYELKEPDEEGLWYFALTNTIAVSFTHDASGRPVVLTMHQAGMDFECPRPDYEYPIEMPLEALEPFLGWYSNEEEDETVELIVHRNHLAAHLASQRLKVELHPPGEDGLWVARMNDELRMRFHPGDDGVEAFTLYEGEDTERRFERVQDEATEDGAEVELPSLEEVLALRQPEARLAAFDALGGVRMSGRLHFFHAGLEGEFRRMSQGRDQMRETVDLGPFGEMHEAHSAGRVQMESSFNPFEELQESKLEFARRRMPAVQFADWSLAYDRAVVTSAGEVDGRACWAVRLHQGELPPATVFVDAETGDILREVGPGAASGPGAVVTSTTFSDFRLVGDLRVPHVVVTSNASSGTLRAKMESIETQREIDEGLFLLRP